MRHDSRHTHLAPMFLLLLQSASSLPRPCHSCFCSRGCLLRHPFRLRCTLAPSRFIPFYPCCFPPPPPRCYPPISPDLSVSGSLLRSTFTLSPDGAFHPCVRPARAFSSPPRVRCSSARIPVRENEKPRSFLRRRARASALLSIGHGSVVVAWRG